MPADRERMRDIFDRARRLPAPQRSVFLSGLAAADEPMRAQIEDMLRALDEAGPFLGAPTHAPQGPAAHTEAAPSSEGPGTRIGPYKLLQLIGEGGFGSVFMAEQERPVVRRVALKIIKLGMDTRQVIARFEAERQALAMMDHPNIARVLDAGATDAGRPYFVMELVRGVPITEYCDTANLSTEERLELFIPVCHAVQHAHQKGIIHRDIKPSNVLITMHDGVPVPKVIDFGIAKATQGRLTEKTLFTEHRQMIGTPEYMSPEQAEMSGLDVDTRSDIYSLGVLLYELLTGTTPFSGQNLRSAAFGEIQRIIREVEPPKPSTRISTLGLTLPGVALHRRCDPRKLGALIRGDLDWIAMKALEKDRVRRYGTANGFAADIRRYLSDEPVEASPPSATYKLRKLAHKYRAPLRAAAVFALLLIGATIFSTWQAVRATRAQAATLVQKERADAQFETATHVTEYLQQMLGYASPDAAKGPDYTVRQLLDDYADTVGNRLAGEPEAEAALQATIGMAYSRLGFRDKAESHLARALALRRRVFGAQHETYANSLVDYANSYWDTPDLTGAVTSLREALAVYRARGVEGHPVIRALWMLQMFLSAQGKWEELEPVVAEGFAEARKSPGREFPEVASMYHNLIESKLAKGQNAQAESLAHECIAMHLRVHGPVHLETAWGYRFLAKSLTAEHKFGESLAADKQSLAIFHKVFSLDNAVIAMQLNHMLTTLYVAGESSALAGLFPTPGDLEELEPLYREALAAKPPLPNLQENPAFAAARGLARLGGVYFQLGREFAAAGRTREAEAAQQKGSALLEGLETQLAENPDLLAELWLGSVRTWMIDGRHERAADAGRKLLASKHENGIAYNDTAWFLASSANPSHRDPILAIGLAERAIRSDASHANWWNTLGVARYRAGDFKQAIVALDRTVQLSGGGCLDFYFLAMAHHQLGDARAARSAFAQGVTWRMQHVEQDEQFTRFEAEARELLGAEADGPSVNQPATQQAPR